MHTNFRCVTYLNYTTYDGICLLKLQARNYSWLIICTLDVDTIMQTNPNTPTRLRHNLRA